MMSSSRSRSVVSSAVSVVGSAVAAISLLAACSAVEHDTDRGGNGDASEASASRSTLGAATACGVPRHPFLAPNGRANIHNDAYMSDTYAQAGTPNRNVAVNSAFMGGECGSINFDAKGRILTVCIGAGRVLRLIDPVSLRSVASYDLPAATPGAGFGGGGYFYVDQPSRAVLPTADGKIVRLTVAEAPTRFVEDAVLDLTGTSSDGLHEEDGVIVSAIPDWSGRIWFVTEGGAVGFVVPDTGERHILRLSGEGIYNSFAVDESGGVFIASDHALYRFDVDAAGLPIATWREPYPRGMRQKPGQVSQGTGTTPTLLEGGLVAITDNAEPKMNVVVYRRSPAAAMRRVCSVPVFQAGRSATENSLIGCGRTIIVENNYGYTGASATSGEGTTTPGVTRVDVRADGTGCDVVWDNTATSVPNVVSKLSLASSAVYTLSKKTDGWYFTTLDLATGTPTDSLLGTSDLLNANYAGLSLAPNGTAYIGQPTGLYSVTGR
jgi:hypothetical protein